MSYRIIDFDIWQDPWFDDLSHESKLVFIYLFTSPHADRCGTQQYAPKLIGYMTGLSRDQVEQCVEEMTGKVTVVDGRIFCHSFIKHQCKTGNFKAGVAASFRSLSAALQNAIAAKSGMTMDELNGTHNHPSSTRVKPSSTEFNPSSTPENGGSNPVTSNKEQVTSKNTHAHARTAEAEAPAEFEMFWESYPRHIDKKRALKAWKARIKDGYSPEAIHTAAKNYAAHCRANKTEEKFIKHPATFVGPDLPFLDWKKQIAIPEEDIEEEPDNGLDEWRISCMSPEQRKQYDRVMTPKQKELYDLTHPDEVRRRQANANAA